jgi:hypothetical protein
VECIAIDWSGAVTGEAAKIWIASAVGGSLTALVAPGSRDAVRDALLKRRRDTAACLVGLDFAFSMPRWYSEQRGWSRISDVWTAASNEGESWLRDCAPPFWGRAGVKRPHDAALGLRETERTWPLSPRPKSVFQIGGAGAVGTGSIRGMPMLLTLREAGWAVWPFDAQTSHTLVEIYPRLFTGPVVKRDETARATYIDAHQITAQKKFIRAMIASEDAFDAGVSAIEMSRTVTTAPWPRPDDLHTQLEGRIWVPDGVGATPPGSVARTANADPRPRAR